MKTIILIAMIAAVAYAEEVAPAESKKQEKRGLLGLGYGGYSGGYYPGVAAGHGYAGYGVGAGYAANPLYSVNHGVVPAYSHAALPAVSYSHGYSAPAVYNPYRVGYAGYNHGLGYNGLAYNQGLGLGLGHGYNYLNNGHYY